MSQDKENLDDIFEATFSQRVDMRQARELKRMKMRHARQDAAAKVKEIQSEANEPAVVKLNPKKKIEYKITDHLGRELNKDGTLKVAEAKLDPVDQKELKGKHADRKDKDIDNDGDSDKTDEYLHNRRKAIKHAMAKKMKEEVEQIDEISKATKAAYLKKAAEDHYQMFTRKKPGSKEKLDKRRAAIQKVSKELTGKKHFSDYDPKTKKFTREEAQLNEISKKTLGSYVNAATDSLRTNTIHAARTGDKKSKNIARKRYQGMYKAVKKLTQEEQEFVDSLNAMDLDEAHIWPGDYKVTSEKSQFGGHRPKVVHKEKGHTVYLGQHSYKTPEVAAKHADAYLKAYTSRGDRAAQNASTIFANANKKHLYVKEEVEQVDEGRKPTMKAAVNRAEKSRQRAIKKAGMQAKRMGGSDEAVKNAMRDHDVFSRDEKHVRSHLGETATTSDKDQIDEISKATMGRYINKAKDAIDAASYRQGTRDSDYSLRKNRAIGAKIEKKLTKRHKGIETAVKKLTREEAEQIDELSKATLGSYIKKADKQATKALNSYSNAAARRHDFAPDTPAMAKNAKKFAKRDSGAYLARTKLAKEEAEQIDEISGKTLASYSDKVARYGPMKDVRTRQKHEKGLYTAYKKMKAKGIKVPARMEEVEIEEGVKAYDKDNKLVGHYRDMKTAKEMKPGHRYVVALTKGWGDGGKSMKTSYGKLTREEVEELDEGHFDYNDMAKHLVGRYGKKITSKHIDSLQNDLDTHKSIDRDELHAHIKKHGGAMKEENANEEVELEEARGRPRKDAQKDYTIHPKTKEKLMHNNPAHMTRINNLYRTGALKRPKTEAGQNIVTQLRKASLSMRGGEKVNFTHGASTHVSAAHAQKILDKHAGMKPAEKEKFQKEIGHSHAMLKKHV